MSHITNVKSQMNDASAIAAALDIIAREHATDEVRVERDAVPRYYGTSHGGQEATRCDFVLRLPGRYDLGLKRQDDGTYSMQCDNELLSGGFGRGDAGRKILGENASVFKQTYTVERLRLLSAKKGQRFHTERAENGHIHIRMGG